MMPMKRGPAPKVLRDNFKLWGKRFAWRRAQNPAARFSWPQKNGKEISGAIRAALVLCSHNHCAFCDGFPLGETGRQTIDHFRPKSLYPRLACAWPNLFLCCDVCQAEKGDTFHRNLLKPDTPDYDFFRFFVFNFRTGEIMANPLASEHDRARALLTIKTFDLNRVQRKRSRKDLLRGGIGQGYDLHDLPYRYLFL